MPTGNGLDLVFQYFFIAGAGIGAGLLLTIGGGYVIYKKIGGLKVWEKKSKR